MAMSFVDTVDIEEVDFQFEKAADEKLAAFEETVEEENEVHRQVSEETEETEEQEAVEEPVKLEATLKTQEIAEKPSSGQKRSLSADEELGSGHAPTKRPRMSAIVATAALLLPVAACSFATGFFGRRTDSKKDDLLEQSEDSDES